MCLIGATSPGVAGTCENEDKQDTKFRRVFAELNFGDLMAALLRSLFLDFVVDRAYAEKDTIPQLVNSPEDIGDETTRHGVEDF